MKRVLGLDIGTNSVGWAVLDVPDVDGEVGAVLALGSRIFVEGAERDGSALVTKAKERRSKRTMRRQILRRSRRMRTIRRELAAVGLLPGDDAEFSDLMSLEPAALIAKSSTGEALTLREIGRVVYWFAARRGFLSLRSGGGDFASAEEVNEKPKRFRREMVDPETGEIVDRGQEGKLLKFLEQQKAHHPNILTTHVVFGGRGRLVYPVRPIPKSKFAGASLLGEFGLHGLVFFQRKVFWHESTVGRCSADPASGQRAVAADRLAQRFRVWKTVIDLRVGDPERPLDKRERVVVANLLMSQATLSFTKLRKALDLDGDVFVNFEKPEKKHLEGNKTDTTLRNIDIGRWDSFSEDQRDEMVSLLIGNAAEEQICSVLVGHFGYSPDLAKTVARAKLPSGRVAFSRRTLRRLLEVLPSSETERDALKVAGFETPEAARAGREVKIGDVTNPLAKAALSQVGRTVRAVARTYGKSPDTPFDVVRIELTRDVRQNRKQRERTSKDQAANKKRNDQASKLAQEFSPGAEASGRVLQKVKLWEGQRQQCLYCGKPISASAIFGGGYEVDHILPRARTLDDSMANKAVVCANENQAKLNRTITEWDGAGRAEEVAARARAMGLPNGVVRRILQADVPDDAIPAALLVQSGYVNALARDFVKPYTGVVPEVSSGRVTAQLRFRMGLRKDPNDHRRHGLDAVAIALCDTRTARQLAADYSGERDYGRERTGTHGAWEPWIGARLQVLDAYEQAIASHVTRGKTSGAFFEETLYGSVTSPHMGNKAMGGRRRAVSAIVSPKLLNEVADPAVRHALESDLRRRGIDPESPRLRFDDAMPPRMADGSPVKKVRCHLSVPGNIVVRPSTEPKTTVASAGNHSAWVYSNDKTDKWRIHVTTQFEMFTNRGRPLRELRAQFAADGEEFRFSVTKGSMLKLTVEGADRILKVTSIEQADRIIYVADPTKPRAAKRSARSLKEQFAQKVVVLPDGQIRTARD